MRLTLCRWQRPDASRPVPRRSPSQRADKPEQLKEFAHRLDSWSESRSNKSIFESWMALSPRVRIAMGLAAIGFSVTGLYVADWLEKAYPNETARDVAPRPTMTHEAPQPRLFSISIVDRES
ncbi:uncharacterized protein MRET_3172 [Malassezia restricta]|uniref:Uncharacterized protein n=1 Tax=Malassezia restricta (strain ATCC 96810 / NBRC 103918 / CBS 7877) TaxID=425264 RepID=A0A3G2S5W5_MALR7|nr:uncharacterized protein MRET_3172 [Malassezia restricta]AXA51365.1 uncharacterized protein MRET_3172 [Malassezia restricta]AYO43464.1 hypothetical protein DNF11_2514 [Malassezia restricta CBS 7877]